MSTLFQTARKIYNLHLPAAWPGKCKQAMREENIKLHLWFGIMLLAWSSAVQAAELRQPATPKAGSVMPVLPVRPGCPPPPVSKTVRAASLIVRNTMRPDVGPYRVMLPGYATEQDPNGDHYAPFVIEAQPGDSLRVDLHNQLDASIPNDGHAIVNLHMDGREPNSPGRLQPRGRLRLQPDREGRTDQLSIRYSDEIGRRGRAWPAILSLRGLLVPFPHPRHGTR